MANKKYTELPQANAITGAEILAMVQDGGSVQGDIDLIKAYFDTLYPTMVYTAPASVTPTFTGFGTVSGINCRTWRVGALLFFEYSFVSGTATGTEARMGLRYNPGGGEVDVTTVSTYPTVQPVGGGGADSQVDRYYTALAEASVTYLTIGMFDGSNPALAKRQGSSVAVSGWRVSLSGSVRVQGW